MEVFKEWWGVYQERSGLKELLKVWDNSRIKISSDGNIIHGINPWISEKDGEGEILP